MREWRSALQSKLMRNIVVSVIALDAAGALMVHYRMTQPVDDELMVEKTSIVVANASDDLLSDARVRPDPVADRAIVKVAQVPVPDFAFYPQAEANSQAPLAEEIERSADAAARELPAATNVVKVADSRPRAKPAVKRATIKVQRATMTFSRAFPEPDTTSAAAPANAIDQVIMSDASRAPGFTRPTIVEGYEHTPDTVQGFEAQPDAAPAPQVQTDAPPSGAVLPGTSELPPLEPTAEPAPFTQLPA